MCSEVTGPQDPRNTGLLGAIPSQPEVAGSRCIAFTRQRPLVRNQYRPLGECPGHQPVFASLAQLVGLFVTAGQTTHGPRGARPSIVSYEPPTGCIERPAALPPGRPSRATATGTQTRARSPSGSPAHAGRPITPMGRSGPTEFKVLLPNGLPRLERDPGRGRVLVVDPDEPVGREHDGRSSAVDGHGQQADRRSGVQQFAAVG